jgi:hypothetical protein
MQTWEDGAVRLRVQVGERGERRVSLHHECLPPPPGVARSAIAERFPSEACPARTHARAQTHAKARKSTHALKRTHARTPVGHMHMPVCMCMCEASKESCEGAASSGDPRQAETRVGLRSSPSRAR